MITANHIAAIVQQNFDKEQRGINIHNEIAELLKAKFNGKKITKRLITYLMERFPNYTITFDSIGSSKFLKLLLIFAGLRQKKIY